MTTRIDHTNCSHPRTPAGRAACRRGQAEAPAAASAPRTREQLMEGMTTKEKARFARQMQSDADRAAARLAKRGRPARPITVVADLPMPTLTPAQLRSPIFQSMMRKPA